MKMNLYIQNTYSWFKSLFFSSPTIDKKPIVANSHPSATTPSHVSFVGGSTFLVDKTVLEESKKRKEELRQKDLERKLTQKQRRAEDTDDEIEEFILGDIPPFRTEDEQIIPDNSYSFTPPPRYLDKNEYRIGDEEEEAFRVMLDYNHYIQTEEERMKAYAEDMNYMGLSMNLKNAERMSVTLMEDDPNEADLHNAVETLMINQDVPLCKSIVELLPKEKKERIMKRLREYEELIEVDSGLGLMRRKATYGNEDFVWSVLPSM